jgi:hypothetical protein
MFIGTLRGNYRFPSTRRTTMAEQVTKGVAQKVTKGTDKDLTGRSVNEPRLRAEGKGDKLRGDARSQEGDAEKEMQEAADRKENPMHQKGW